MKHRCRDVTRLILQAEDRRLSLLERLSVRAHLALCDACSRFLAQTRLLRLALDRWRAEDEGAPPAAPPDGRTATPPRDRRA